MAAKPDADQFEPRSRAQWRKWLSTHHATSPGIWLVSWKKATGNQAFDYDTAVLEALCFGWIDSRPRALDAERSMLWFSPRKAGSGWSRPNKQRTERARDEGLMTAAGQSVIDAAVADGSWTKLDDIEDLVIPDDLVKAFDRHPTSRAQFEVFPRSAKRGILEWIEQAKRSETRAKRVETTAEMAARGERANQWRRSS